MSLVKTLDERGPRIDPCGTPRSVLRHPMKMKLLLILTL